MPAALPTIEGWDNFYVIVGSSAAGLTGLTFVLIALASDRHVVRLSGLRTFITPVVIGAIAARLDPPGIDQLAELGRRLGVAFQIQDDVLNLAGDVGDYGKEIGGDLWEGKRTLLLAHALS